MSDHVSWPPPRPPLPAIASLTHASLAAFIVDPTTDTILGANPAAAHLLGCEPAALEGARFSRLHPGQVPALIVFSEAVLAKGHYWTRGLQPRHATVGELRVEYRGDRLAGPDGQALLLVTVIDLEEQDRHATDTAADRYVTGGLAEWERVDRLFRDIERQNQLILKAAGEGIYGVNAEGRTTFVNPAAERIVGWTAEELVGKDMHAILHHHHPDGSPYPSSDCPIYAAFRDGAVHTVSDEVFWRKDGTAIPVEYTSTPIRERGALVGAVIVFRDVTQRKTAEDELRGALVEVDRLRQRLELENAYLQEELRIEVNHRGIIGESGAIESLNRQIELVARTEASVLISGESGTGKELIASAIHDASERSTRPLIRVNCAAIARDLFESEFFGHVKGAFTGALRDRIGRFELAHGGTLFLDEVGEIPIELQGKLLRVLQEGQFERVGEERTRAVDVRIVAATNRDLSAEIKAGRFREDLYFRLGVFPIQSLPLRERREDIPLLVGHFLSGPNRKGASREHWISEADMRRLQRYEWPGNVRELQNVIERAVILSRDGRLRIDLPTEKPAPEPATADAPALRSDKDRRTAEREDLVAALKRAKGRVSGTGGAADLLGVRPTTLASRLKALGLVAGHFKG